MEKLWFPEDIAERYHCSLPTARRYIRQGDHQEKPLCMTEAQLRAWEFSRTVPAGRQEKEAEPKRKRRKDPGFVWVPGVSRIPRMGEEAQCQTG